MLRVGLTGGIASGKSTVADGLARRGATIIDADQLAREVVSPGTPGFAAVVERFGPDVIRGEALDRRALGRIVFADPAARRDLEAIILPTVRARAADLEALAGPDAVVVHVIPLLVETAQEDVFDVVVVVDVDPETQRARLAERDGFAPAEAEARIGAQASRSDRLGAAGVGIDNQGSLIALEQQIDNLWAKLSALGATG